MKNLLLVCCLTSYLAYPIGRQAHCQAILNNIDALTQKTILSDDGKLNGEATTALKIFTSHFQDQSLVDLLDPKQVIDILGNPELSLYSHHFSKVMTDFNAHQQDGGSSTQKLEDSFRRVLKDRVPESSIEARIQGLKDGTKESLMRALGDMTRPETLELLHGGDPLHPTKDSLVGKYLAETGASTLIRGFTREPNVYDSKNTGPQRLVVAVSEKSFPEFSKYFMRPELFSVHGHAHISNNHKLTSYSYQGVDFRLPSTGYILPQAVLKTSEAQRLQTFFKLLVSELAAGKSFNSSNRAMHPWSIPGYIPEGNNLYLNCTHWIGNIPVGDNTVQSLTLPSNNNQPVVRALKPYQSDERLITQVWKSPGQAQMSDVLGVLDHNGQGNMASPGYVIHTLLGETPVDKVPLVIYVVDDHHKPIPPDFKYTVEGAH